MTKTRETLSQFIGDLVASVAVTDGHIGWMLHDGLINSGRDLLAGALHTFPDSQSPFCLRQISPEVLDFLDRNW